MDQPPELGVIEGDVARAQLIKLYHAKLVVLRA
jgi:hypothetical protein